MNIVTRAFVLSKHEGGYDLISVKDGSAHHMKNCGDLWEAVDNLHHYLHLTPSLLSELNFFRAKCAELHWDEAAVAAYYESAADGEEAAAGRG